MISTEAWVLYAENASSNAPHGLVREIISFDDLREDEVLVEPLYGCWEGNMAHAVARQPVDICIERGEEKVVLGNSGVVRILQCGAEVRNIVEGDICLVFCSGCWDRHGYPIKIFGYDARGTIGLLAKRTKLHEKQLILLPRGTRFHLRQWAAFSLRYITAWANWKLAIACWQAQRLNDVDCSPWTWGWGGGVSFAELTLANHFGFRTALIASRDARLALARDHGIVPIDRRKFRDLHFDEHLYRSDLVFREQYQQVERNFLDHVLDVTNGCGVSIFVDLIGLPVHRVTLKALTRPGIITSAGWKLGMTLSTIRALECMNWHVHVHTHYARLHEGVEAMSFAEEHGWIPVVPDCDYKWEEIPQLASDYSCSRIASYFPVYQINAV